MLRNYFKITRRNLLKDRGYSLLNLVGLYIGFVCMILTVLYLTNEFSYDTYHPNAQQTYRFLGVDDNTGAAGNETAAPWGPAMKEQFPEIAQFVRTIGQSTAVFEVENQRFYESGGLLADASILEVFSIELVAGSAESALNDPFEMILSEQLAEKYFGPDDPIGQVIKLDNEQLYTVTGVFADKQKPTHLNFSFISSFDSHNDWFKTEWNMLNYTTYFQLRSDVQPAVLANKITAYFKDRFGTPENEFENHAELQPITDIHLYDDSANQTPRFSSVLLVGVIGLFILIIALVNYINLVTARSVKRLKEVGVRKSIGAQRRQLTYQFLIENFMVCFMVFLLSIVSFKLFLPAFNDLMNTTLSFDFLQDFQLLAALFLITGVASLLSGFYPAFVLSSLKPVSLVKNTTGILGGKNYLRKWLTTFQFVVSIALIIGTALVYKQLQYMLNKDIGFDKEQVVVIPLSNTAIRQSKDVFANQLADLPQVKDVSLSANSMGGGDWGMPFQYEGGEDPVSVRFMAVDADYGATLGLRLKEGRFFSKELSTDVESSFIVNQSFLDAVGWQTGIGKEIQMPNRNAENPWSPGKIIGVVQDFNFRSLHSQVRPMVISNKVDWTSILFIKLHPGPVDDVLENIADAWTSAEPNIPFGYYFLDEQLAAQYEVEERLSKTATVFGSIAIILACIGLFSLATYMAEQKMKEVSIRKVMGASLKQIWLLFSRQFIVIILISAVLAIPLSLFYLDSWLSTFAFRIELRQNIDIPLLAALSTLVIALLTVAIQSIRLTRANPVKFLRSE